jgi:nitroreductase/NAD-dependent dihydropyrimidine dehydrogenase PreA subunit
MAGVISVNRDTCNRCGICVLSCPVGIYAQQSKDDFPVAVDRDLCVSCGHCVAVCPRDAIIHSSFPAGRIKPVIQQNLPIPEQVVELLRTRRSIRVFQDRPIGKDILEKIIEAAQLAPSSHNRQTTRYTVVQDKKLLDKIVRACAGQYAKTASQLGNPLIRNLLFLVMRNQAHLIAEITPALKKLAKDLAAGSDSVLRNAPALIIFHADERQMMPDINAQLALQNAALMTHALGLGSFYTGYLLAAYERDKSIGKLFNLPLHHRMSGGLALGYPRFQYKKWISKTAPQVTWL